MANEFIIKNGFRSRGNSQITGSLSATSFIGDGSGLNSVSAPPPAGTVSSSAQIASDISGSFVAPSASFSSRVTTNETNITTLTADTGSYAVTDAFAQFSSVQAGQLTATSRVNTDNFRVATATEFTFIGGGINVGGNVTSSANILATGTVLGSNLSGTNTGDQDLSSYALTAAVSGAFGAPSASFSSRVTTLEGASVTLPAGVLSGSAQIASNISGSVKNIIDDVTIDGSLTISGSTALSITSSENISIAQLENGGFQSYCIPQVHYHAWYYNTTTRPIFEDDYINFGWAGTDLELTVKQLGTDDNVHITKNIGNSYSFLSKTDTSQFDLDGSMSAEESSFFYITNIHDDSYPMYKVIVTRAATDGTNKNMYMLVEKIKKTL